MARPKNIKGVCFLSSLMKKGEITRLKAKTIVYDENLDILELDNGLKTSYCVKFGDLAIVHYDSKNKLIGVELFGVSQLHQIDRALLTNIKSAQMIINIIPREKRMFITVKLVSVIENKQVTASVIATPPIETPLTCH